MPDIFVSKKKAEKPASAKPKPPLEKNEKAIDRIVKRELGQMTASPLASFAVRPKIKFETQERKEKIVLLLRRHPITNLDWMLKAILMFSLPILIPLVVSFDLIPPNFALVGTIGWYLLIFAYAFERFLTWLFNVNIITDERIVDIDFPSLLYRHISETKIDKVQEVNTVTGGFARTLFNYGDVVIQTAGEMPEICFEAIPNPSRVSVVLNELILEEEREKIEGRVR